ncbi:MAG: DUF5915 domain-containing protein, partial [Halobacteria archaeon]|nr:DUF5915 domain-containing protein [Halobacteria archaeon]
FVGEGRVTAVETDEERVGDALSEDDVRELLLDRVNSKSVDVVESWDELVEVADPQMGAIGPEFGSDAEDVMEAVRGATRDEVEEGVELDGETVELTDEMVEFEEETPDDVESAEFEGGTVYVDVSLDDEIRSEGYAREVVRRVQEMRKQLDLDVEERIRVALDFSDERVEELALEHDDYVAQETRADEFVDVDSLGDGIVEDWDVEGVEITIGVERV